MDTKYRIYFVLIWEEFDDKISQIKIKYYTYNEKSLDLEDTFKMTTLNSHVIIPKSVHLY